VKVVIPYFEKLKVTSGGKVTIRFSEPFLVPGKPEEINQDVLEVKLL
jgi:hypothetical protein